MKTLLTAAAIAIGLTMSSFSGCDKFDDDIGDKGKLIEYYELQEISGKPATGRLTLFFKIDKSPDNFIASVTSLPSSGTWKIDKGILRLGAEEYRIDQHSDGLFRFHRGGVTYKFRFLGNNK